MIPPNQNSNLMVPNFSYVFASDDECKENRESAPGPQQLALTHGLRCPWTGRTFPALGLLISYLKRSSEMLVFDAPQVFLFRTILLQVQPDGSLLFNVWRAEDRQPPAEFYA